jgi:hypothetical protein
MKTILFSIDEFIEYIKKAKTEGFTYVVLGVNTLLEATAPSKKKNCFKLRYELAGDAFSEKDVRPLFDNPSFNGVLLKSDNEKYLNQEFLKKIKEELLKGIEFKKEQKASKNNEGKDVVGSTFSR